jgi:hypothetical protein
MNAATPLELRGASMNQCKQCQECKCQPNERSSTEKCTTWLSVDELAQRVPMPVGYRLEQLKRADIPELITCLEQWYPDMRVGAASVYLQEDFYTNEVFLRGEAQKDTLVLVGRCAEELVAILSFERETHSLTLYGGLGVIAPQHRGKKFAHLAPACLEAMGRGIGYGLVYYLATLRIPQTQAVAEAAGFQLVGIMPASDRIIVAPGVVKHMYEGIYAKVLVNPSDMLALQDESLTPKTKALFEFLFGVGVK